MKDDKFMDVGELSEYLKVSRSSIYKLAQNKEIPSCKIGRRWRFVRAEIDAWILNDGNVVENGNAEDAEEDKRDGHNRVLSLSRILDRYGFTTMQHDALRLLRIDSTVKFVAILATKAGRNILSKALDLSENELDDIATNIAANLCRFA